jgi:formylglycine-generating enzyme required for sulfatase activity
MKLVLLPAGEFLMGSPEGEEGRNNDETQHRVKLTRPFYLGVHQVTQGQYQAVMGKNPSRFKGEDRPVERVSWNDTVAFCKKLSEREGKEYRLPTEAEWEYACRAGTNTRFNFGDEDGDLSDYGWYDGNSGRQTHPVGLKRANGWGLHDMHGNVWEWCLDAYEKDYPTGLVVDPYIQNGESSVLRGGCWDFNPRFCRSAYRNWYTPGYTYYSHGFRVVCVVRLED